ncbi:MAG TPA: FecR domain-containing protein [Chitinophaga sp.]|uniref:FecR family protein n=1 Tax=Chitinophaga sp. TaxID=1869181 RepID=UPI002BAE8D96|nr:FecR domain-containing protein [Chitinophaga sp.]HVI49187.1 FecR domain-containing protein [Chitinophaga sp.]
MKRHYDGVATPAETAELFAELGKAGGDDDWAELINELYSTAPADPAYDTQQYEPQISCILAAGNMQRRVGTRWWMAAAAILLLGSTAVYFFMQRSGKPVLPAVMPVAADVQPARNGAVLTLANGSQLVLDSLGNGVVTTQRGTKVSLYNGQLAYDAAEGTDAGYNTVSTPRGRKFRLQLPDGTLVWLNAASAIRFPTAFTGHERKVTLRGEAYFEVAKDKRLPFVVDINDSTSTEVLGTHFNINAYPDEGGITATLMEGAIKMKVKQWAGILKPAQQLYLSRNGNRRLLNNADTAAVMAWKNGVISFQDRKLPEIMRLLNRWYDIDVVYETTPPDITFFGEIGSDVNLSSVLTFLRESGVRFRLEGRQLIVTN